jgi:signal transduction histidine kinase
MAYSQSEETVRDTSYVRLLNERATDMLESEATDSVKAIIDEALNLSELLNDFEGEAHATNNLVKYYLDRGRPTSVIETVEEDFDKYLPTEYAVQIGNILATAYNRVGNFRESLELYLQMRDLAEERGDDRMVMGITQNLGNTYGSLGDIPEAINSYLTSLELAEEAKDTLVIAVVLDNLASINEQAENYELAEEYLTRALELNRKINNRRNQITNHMSFGILYKNWGKYDDAAENYSKVLEISDELDNIITEIQGLYNFGLLYDEMEEYDRAMEMFERSLEMSREYGIGIGAFYNQTGMANVYVDLGENEQAAEFFEESLVIAESVGAQDLIRETVNNLYGTYERMGDTLKAYPYLKRYSAMRDSLAETERENALARQEVVLGLRLERENRELAEAALMAEKRNFQITISLLGVLLVVLMVTVWFYLNKKEMNKKLRSRTDELISVNKEKDKLLSVLSHDLRSPLSNIKGVVYLIRENALKGNDINTALDEIDAKLQSGINTLTNYLQWAQSQQEGIVPNIKLVDLFPTVQNVNAEFSMASRNKNISLLNNVPQNSKALADTHMLSVILRNIISNAIKFVSADGSGKVIVEMEETENDVQLRVIDNGEGMDAEQKKNIFKAFKPGSKGTDGEKGTGLGLSICKYFAHKQGGSITFKSTLGKGTVFIVHMQKQGKNQ